MVIYTAKPSLYFYYETTAKQNLGRILGFIVESHDVEQTAQKLKVLYDSPILAKSFQEANRSLISRY